MDDKVVVVSCVRDFDAWNRWVKNNSFHEADEIVPFDNRQENKSISIRYNSFLNQFNFSKPAWFVFIHEDFEFLEPLSTWLRKMDKRCIYGAQGSRRSGMFGIGIQKMLGCPFGRHEIAPDFRTVCTLDCASLIVHSSLIRKYGLRFDENLLYDLYVDDFCAYAKYKFGIQSFVANIYCQHHCKSMDTLGDRLWKSLPYLREKYPDAYFSATCAYFGSFPYLMRLQRRIEARLGFNPKYYAWMKEHDPDAHTLIPFYDAFKRFRSVAKKG